MTVEPIPASRLAGPETALHKRSIRALALVPPRRGTSGLMMGTTNIDIISPVGGVRIDVASNEYVQNARKLEYATKGGKVDVRSSAAVTDRTAEPSVFGSAWRSFMRGFSNTLGVAPVRRPVEEPGDAFRAVANEIRQAIEVAKGRG